MKELTLNITHCIKCPYHLEFSDAGSADSFDAMDTSIVCTKRSSEKAKGLLNPNGYRYINASDRPWRHAQEPIPRWCPLKEVK